MIMEEDSTGLKSARPGPELPYSVSMPMTFGIAMVAPWDTAPAWAGLEILARVDPIDLPPLAPRVGHQGADVDDPLSLLPRDASPVVGVGRIGEVLVLLELVADGRQEVFELDPLLPLAEEALDRHLLRPPHDVLDHRARVEVLEVQDFLVARGVGHLQEPVLVGRRVHPLDRGIDHPQDGLLAVAAGLPELVPAAGNLGPQILGPHLP